MADFAGFQFPKTFNPERVLADAALTLGVTGVPTGSGTGAGLPMWITSVTPTGSANPTGASIGMYTVNLRYPFAGGTVSASMQDSPVGSTAAAGGTADQLIAKVVSVDTVVQKRIVLQVINCTTGSATTPTPGTVLIIQATFANSTAI